MPKSSSLDSKPEHFSQSQPEQGKITLLNPWLVKAVVAMVFVWAGLLAPVNVYGEEKIDVLFYDNYFPYSYEEEGMPAGLYVELTKKIMDSTPLKVTYRIYPFKRAMALGKQGTGLVSGLYKTPERQRYFDFSRPYYTENIALITDKRLPETLMQTEFSSIKGWRIGLLRGMNYGPAIDNALKNGTIIEDRVDSDLLNYKKLKQGRIDGFVIDRTSGKKLINDNGDETLVIHPESLNTRAGIHIVVAKTIKNSRQIISQIDAALMRMERDGSYQKILDSFVGNDGRAAK
ncbi:MAG: amino acid ABC transporter substrate-binding protein [Gammaproteobacteria bacterium]|nr:amino acid ABC transporter substrate-binding protein [Gammaproteobacteria bacterium]MCP4982918.1 amino acid ABC transporter substrate-binding protein [Gammaproteobacteria bacterium]